MDWKFKLSEIRREEKLLTIGITAEGPYNAKVRSPKVVAVVDSTTDNRRFPINMSTYFPLEDMKSCMIYAEYPVNLETLMVTERVQDYTISFDFVYGEELHKDIQLDVQLEEGILNQQGIYKDKETGRLILKADRRPPGVIERIWRSVKCVLAPVYQGITYLIALLLLPWYFVDAVASIILGISDTYPKNTGNILQRFLRHISWRYSKVCKYDVGYTGIKNGFLNFIYYICHIIPVKSRQVLFLSSRRDDLTGNFSFVYDELKKDNSVHMKFVLDPHEIREMSFVNIIKVGYYAATAGIILIDDYTPILSAVRLRKKTTLIQLWHACGAFKTFGFSRIGKRGGPIQKSKDHRNYDYAIVSSSEIRPFYAEGFGIAEEKVVATGVPRTDVFFDAEYKDIMQKQLYQNYPQLKGKKVILFAPTFRGNGKLSASYPREQFEPVKFMECLSEDYALVIKHHPFVQMEYDIPVKWEERILDLSKESEINDLLFITDILITDYSSVVFEAALLRIPMLMYAFDLRQYIASRDFYYDYDFFVPGKIVENFKELVEAIKKEDYEQEKLENFRTRFFDDLDGKSTERVVKLIYNIMESQKG